MKFPEPHQCWACGGTIPAGTECSLSRRSVPVYGRIGHPSSEITGFEHGPNEYRHLPECPKEST